MISEVRPSFSYNRCNTGVTVSRVNFRAQNQDEKTSSEKTFVQKNGLKILLGAAVGFALFFIAKGKFATKAEKTIKSGAKNPELPKEVEKPIKKTSQLIQNLDLAIEKDPNNVALLSKRAAEHKALGNISDAIDDLSKVIEIEPKFEHYDQRALLHRDSGNFEEAIKDYSYAIEVDPQDVNVYVNRGLAYRQAGQLDKALEDYNQAIALDSTNSVAYYNRGRLYSKMKNHYKEAFEDASKSAELSPKDKDYIAFEKKARHNYSGFLTGQGLVCEKNGNCVNAFKYYSESLQLIPEQPQVLAHRGFVNEKLGDFEGAFEDYTQALNLKHSKPATVLLKRGTLYARLGENEKAFLDYESAIKIAPKYSGTYVNRALLYSDLGEHTKALEDIDKAIALDSKNKNFKDLKNAMIKRSTDS